MLRKWFPLLLASALIVACFFPWITIPSRSITVGGFESTIQDYGKPGIFHCMLIGIVILLLLLNRTWSVRTAFFISAFNVAWAIRNFLILGACSGGVCPQKLPALYVIFFASILLPAAIAMMRMNKSIVDNTASEP